MSSIDTILKQKIQYPSFNQVLIVEISQIIFLGVWCTMWPFARKIVFFSSIDK